MEARNSFLFLFLTQVIGQHASSSFSSIPFLPDTLRGKVGPTVCYWMGKRNIPAFLLKLLFFPGSFLKSNEQEEVLCRGAVASEV